MVAGRPWYQRNPADFIMAVRGFELELVGAYSLIIDHLNDRDRALPDDDRFMAGLLHCSPQRWRKLKAALIGQGKIVLTEDGYLTNARFERERAQRMGDHEAAVLWGRAGGLERARRHGQTELDLDAGWDDHPEPSRARTGRAKTTQTVGEVVAKHPEKFRESSGTHSRDQKQKPNKINTPAQPPPQAPCAREESRDQSKDSSLPTVGNSDSRPRVADTLDLKALLDVVCEAAGYRPYSPAQVERSLAQVAEWQRQQVSFDDVILPTIATVMAQSGEPTRTLGRFKVPVAHEHARLRAIEQTRRPYEPPAVLSVKDDADPRIDALRDRLRKDLGPRAYDGWLKPTAMSLNGTGLTVITPSPFMADWVRDHFGELLAKIASVERVDVRSA